MTNVSMELKLLTPRMVYDFATEIVLNLLKKDRNDIKHNTDQFPVGAHDKEETIADVSALDWLTNDWLAPEETKMLPADQSGVDTSAHISSLSPLIMCL
ncbi:hypothetical protein Tco_1490801 [Tanacetum coccineum]